MKRKRVSRRKFKKVFNKNSKMHKRNLPGMFQRGGRRLPV